MALTTGTISPFLMSSAESSSFSMSMSCGRSFFGFMPITSIKFWEETKKTTLTLVNVVLLFLQKILQECPLYCKIHLLIEINKHEYTSAKSYATFRRMGRNHSPEELCGVSSTAELSRLYRPFITFSCCCLWHTSSSSILQRIGADDAFSRTRRFCFKS